MRICFRSSESGIFLEEDEDPGGEEYKEYSDYYSYYVDQDQHYQQYDQVRSISSGQINII